MRQSNLSRLIMFLVLLCAITPSRGLPQDSSKIIATVNKTEITEGDLQFMYVSRRVPETRRAAVREFFIDALIDRALLAEYLAGKVKVSDKLIDRYVARIEGLVKRDGKKFDEVLKAMGYSRATFRREIAQPLAWEQHARLAITDTAIQKFWTANKPKYDGTEVTAAHIVKRAQKDVTADEIKMLTDSLAALRKTILNGDTTFTQAAAKNSESPTRSKGGSLGAFPYSGRMPQEIAEVAFRLKEGEISEPFRTRFGIHILQVSRIEPGLLSLEDARAEIIKHLSIEMRSRLLEALRMKATISKPGSNDGKPDSSDGN